MTGNKSGLLARRIALNVINSTLKSKKSADELFNNHKMLNKIDQRDRNFSYNLIMTTLRHLGQIDDMVKRCLNTELPKKAYLARDILRLGICQLVFLRTPPHAAVNTSLVMAEIENQGPYKKLLNALLRRIEREKTSIIKEQDAAKLNTPDWLWNSWVNAYGEIVTRKIALAHMKVPTIDISVKSNITEWAKKLEGAVLPTGSIRLRSSSNITAIDGFNQGEWWVQDAAARLPSTLFTNDLKGSLIADICAAPGGKTAQLINSGANVVAVDRSKARLKILNENLSRLSYEAKIICTDATKWKPDNLFDGVLVDAPCSSTGTIRRHPDVKYLKSPEDVSKAHDAQLRLLSNAAEITKIEGQIIYSTCSLQAEEGPDIIDIFLREYPNWRRDIIKNASFKNNREFITKNGDLRTLPHFLSDLKDSDNQKITSGMDGFFAARLVRLN